MIQNIFYDLNFHSIFPVIAVILNIFLQLISIRIFKFFYFKSILFGFFFGIIIIIFYEFLILLKNESFYFHILINFINYIFFSFFYFAILSTTKTSLRLRILHEISINNQGLSLEEIYLKYNSEEIIKIRVKRMVQNNQISFNENKYFSKLSITLIIGLCLDVAKLILFNKNKCNNIYFNNNKL